GRPYPASDPLLQAIGTSDKLLIGGHYYTDKPPLPAVLLAGVYWGAQRVTGLNARDDTAWFCRLMAMVQSGLAYVVAVTCFWRVGQQVRLPDRVNLALTALFALATIAVCYTRVVNSHILLLALTSLMLASMLRSWASPSV